MQLEKLLETYTPFNADEESMVRQLKMFLNANGNAAYDRGNLIAHVVADAWIVDPERRQVVQVEHGLNLCWMAPGGHCDGSSDVIAAARREAEEEAGLINLDLLLDGQIYDINTGYVPLRTKNGVIEPPHLHLDVCFAFEAPANAALKISDESTNLRWVPVDELDKIKYWPAHLRRIEKMRAGILSAKEKRYA